MSFPVNETVMADTKKQVRRLIGDYETNIDSKGRAGLGRFRQYYADSVIAVRMSNFLLILSTEQFDLISSGIRRKTSFSSEENVYKLFNMDMQLFKRHFYSNAFEVSLDSQGRMTIPKKMREHLHLVEDVVWVGCGDTLELWQAREYEKNQTLWEHEGGPDRISNILTAPEMPEQSGDGGPSEAGERDQE